MRTKDLTISWSRGDEEFQVEVRVTPDDPGRSSGPPEDCSPPEPGEVEVLEVWELLTLSKQEGERVPHTIRWRRRLDLEEDMTEDDFEGVYQAGMEALYGAEEADEGEAVDHYLEEQKERRLSGDC